MIFEPGRLYYVATPYTKWPEKSWAWKDACRAVAALSASFPESVFHSPIAECYGREVIGRLELSHQQWLARDKAMMDVCSGIVVVQLPRWNTSRGMSHEANYFDFEGKSMVYAFTMHGDEIRAYFDDLDDGKRLVIDHPDFGQDWLAWAPEEYLREHEAALDADHFDPDTISHG